jgi:hypothetical protein
MILLFNTNKSIPVNSPDAFQEVLNWFIFLRWIILWYIKPKQICHKYYDLDRLGVWAYTIIIFKSYFFQLSYQLPPINILNWAYLFINILVELYKFKKLSF